MKQPTLTTGDIIQRLVPDTKYQTYMVAYGFHRGFYRITGVHKSSTTKIEGYNGLVYSMERITKDGRVMKSKLDPGRSCFYVDKLIEIGEIIKISPEHS